MILKILFILLVTAILIVDSRMQFKIMDKEEHPTKEGFRFYVLNCLFMVFYYLCILFLL